MPSYAYQCPNCQFTHDKYVQTIKRNNCQKCPKCNETMDRLIGGGSGFILKGTGFYSTTYRKN